MVLDKYYRFPQDRRLLYIPRVLWERERDGADGGGQHLSRDLPEQPILPGARAGSRPAVRLAAACPHRGGELPCSMRICYLK